MPPVERESTGRKELHCLGPQVCSHQGPAFLPHGCCSALCFLAFVFAGLGVQRTMFFRLVASGCFMNIGLCMALGTPEHNHGCLYKKCKKDLVF